MSSAGGFAPSRASCDHCGLPVTSHGKAQRERTFCCVGCRFAAAITEGGEESARRFLEGRLLFAAILAMGVMTFSVASYSETFYVLLQEEGGHVVLLLTRIALAAFSLPVFLLLGVPLLRGAWLDLRQGLIRMDGLIVLATVAAYAVSIVNTIQGAGQVYYETGTMVLVLVMFGRRLEAHARTQGRDAARRLVELLPKRAARRSASGVFEEVAVESLVAGDVVRVKPGASIPADVRILSGESEVTRAHLTGEERSVSVGPGDPLEAGSINGNGSLELRVESPWQDGALGHIRDLLETPLTQSPWIRRVDRLASRLVQLALLLAVAAFILGTTREHVAEGIERALAVLLVACPCALGLATPLAYRAMRARLARHRILVRDPAAFEQALLLDRMVLDKTGTLTDPEHGTLELVAGSPAAYPQLLSLVSASGHALAPRRAESWPAHVRVQPGLGVSSVQGGREEFAGSPTWMDRMGFAWDEDVRATRRQLEDDGRTLIAFARDQAVTALAEARAPLRPGVEDALVDLRDRGISCTLLSGDHEVATRRVADPLGLAWEARCRPETKRERILTWQEGGERVGFAGDGVNDGPGLRAADLSFTLGTASGVAQSEARVHLLDDDLARLPTFFRGARELHRTVTGNLVWTLVYNGIALTAAVFGWLHPLLAAAAMIVSSLTVCARSYALLDDPESPAS